MEKDAIKGSGEDWPEKRVGKGKNGGGGRAAGREGSEGRNQKNIHFEREKTRNQGKLLGAYFNKVEHHDHITMRTKPASGI